MVPFPRVVLSSIPVVLLGVWIGFSFKVIILCLLLLLLLIKYASSRNNNEQSSSVIIDGEVLRVIPVPEITPLNAFFQFFPVKGTKKYTLFQKWHSELGPVIKLSNIYSVTDADHIQQIYQDSNNAKYPVRTVLSFLSKAGKVLGMDDSLATANGESWHHQRQFAARHYMNPLHMKTFTEPLSKVSFRFADLIEEVIQGDTKDRDTRIPSQLKRLNERFALEAITQILFDRPIGALHTSMTPEVDHYMCEAFSYFTAMGALIGALPLWSIHPRLSPAFMRLTQHLKSISEFADLEVEKYIERSKRPDFVPPKHKAFIEITLNQTAVSKDEAKRIFTGTLTAGIATTANFLTWVLYALSLNPEPQEKLYNEIMKVVGNQSVVTNEHLKDMSYLKNIIKETARLYPVVLGNMKFTTDDVYLVSTINEEKISYRIPAGSPVTLNHLISSTDQKHWGTIDVNKFVPERFEKDDFHPFSSLIFGYGPRVCVGMKIASTELLLATLAVVQRFKLEWKGKKLASFSQNLVSEPDVPLEIAFYPREN